MDSPKKPHFDAAGFLESQGLTFKGFDKATGHALVENDETGEPGTFDVKSLLKKEGMNPDADVTFNTPDNPLNETPVGVMDRLKLSLGNTKGAVGYLKSKFQDARVDDTGSLVVKDQGAWKKVDLDGLGDDSGWKVSEILGDIADVGGDALVGAGSLAALGATGGAGAVGLAAAGSGAASAIKGVLGRFANTYDATPEEFAKDVMFDTALGVVGEGVAIGGKALLGPTLKRGFSKLANVGEATQDMLAKGFAAVDPENGAGTYRTILQRGEDVVESVAKANDRAAAEATSFGADAAGKGTLGQTQSELLGKVLYEDTVEAAKPLVENIQGAMTGFYEREIQSAFKETLTPEAFKQAQTNIKQYGQEALTQMKAFFNDAGLMQEVTERAANVQRQASSVVSRNGGEPVTSTISSATKSATKTAVAKDFVSPKSLAKWASERGNQVVSADSLQIKDMVKALNGAKNLAETLATKGVKTPKDLVEMMKMSKAVSETLDLLPQEQRALLEATLEKRIGNIDKAVKNSLPDALQAKYDRLRSTYREVAGNMRKLTSGLDGAKSAVNFDDVAGRLVEHFRATQFEAPSAEKAAAHNILKSLQTINPNAGTHLSNLQLKNAAMAFGGASIASSLSTSGAIARSAAFLGKKAVLPAAMSVSKMQRRASLKAFLGSESGKQFMNATRVIKAGGNRVAQRPELLAAGLTTALSALKQR
jgi:hypothetical protein